MAETSFGARRPSEKTAASPQGKTLSFTVTASWGENKTEIFHFGQANLVPEETGDGDPELVGEQYSDKRTVKSIRYLSAASWQTVLQKMAEKIVGSSGKPIENWTLNYTHTDTCLHYSGRYGTQLRGRPFWEDVFTLRGTLDQASKMLEKTFSSYHPWALVYHKPEAQASSWRSAMRRITDLASSPQRQTIRRAHTSGGERGSETVGENQPGRCSVLVTVPLTSLDQPPIDFVLTAQSSTSPQASELERRKKAWTLPTPGP